MMMKHGCGKGKKCQQNILYAIQIFRNKNISKKLKLRLKNTIIDKVLTYASETCILTEIESKHF